MEGFLELQQKIKRWYARNEGYVLPVVKFLTMLGVLLMLNWHLGYRLFLMRWVLVILASLVSCLLPWSGLTAIVVLWLVGHMTAISWEASVVLGAVLLLDAMLHYLFLPGASFLIVLVPMAFCLHVPYLVPLLAGIFGGPLAFIPVCEGVMMYCFLSGIETNAAYLLDTTREITEQFASSTAGISGNTAFVTALIAFGACTIVVYAIHRMSFDYARYIAAGIGAVVMLVVYLIAYLVFGADVSPAAVLLGSLVSFALAEFFSVWDGALNYTKPEFLQYEDDEYVYYVKAVPKMVMQESDPQVREFSGRGEKET